MKAILLSQLAQWTGGRLLGEDCAVTAVATDTRTLAVGAQDAVLFVALKGERFDGHAHADDAVAAGVRALLVDHALAAAISQVVVANTERALAALAARLSSARAGKIIAITGSNGKTSVKSLLLAILQRAGTAYANPGNRNNEIGLPLAVIDAPEDAAFAIYEMGAGKPGDIAYLTAIARPDVALVNNIAPAHLERMHTLLGVADTKAAIYDALPAGGVAVINADDAFAPYFAERAHGRRLIRFGLEATADVTARDVVASADGSQFELITPAGNCPVQIALPGRHNVLNALAATSLALAAGASLTSIREGLESARAVAGRLVTHRLPDNVVLIDDSYNANPGSLNAAIDTLASAGVDSWLVLGDMRELGEDARALHAEAGRRARSAGIARLFTLGTLSEAAAEAFGEGASHYMSHAALADAIRTQLQPGVRILVKGSRGSAMDKVVRALLPAAGETPHAA
jgi:UDP-N-acetylmuramoyl-tripeptide--D-alanyl-D-alanine ligase